MKKRNALRILIGCVWLCLLGTEIGSAASPAPSMYADRRARQVGDILTVEIVERATAQVSARTATTTENKNKMDGGGSGTLDFIPLFGLDANQKSEQKGDGQTTRQGVLRATLAVKVVEVLPNGDLKIQGQRVVNINGEKQLSTLTGIVRSDDITPENTVPSYLIAEAKISYSG
ncbi:MAG: flagellar basal body L-ring protein FlgH, partial [bacterium]